MNCEQCQYWWPEACEFGFKGWPSIGDQCDAFEYEPGTYQEGDTEEIED